MKKISTYKKVSSFRKLPSFSSEVLRHVVFIVPSQSASVSPPIGPILGQFGINIMEFCKQFNERSKIFDKDVLVIVNLILYKNKSFIFTTKPIPFTFLINESNYYLNEDEIPNFVNLSDIFKIFKITKQNLTDYNNKYVFKQFLGTLRSMHIKICNDLE